MELNAGAEALAYIKANPPVAAMVVDLTLPDMDGAELCQKIRQHPGWESVPVVLASGHPVSKENLAEIGAQGLLRKPIDLSDLHREIKMAMGLKKSD